jgi:hypothetical protein
MEEEVYEIKKCPFCGEPIDSDSIDFMEDDE